MIIKVYNQLSRYLRASLLGIAVILCLQGSNANAYDFQKAKRFLDENRYRFVIGIGVAATLLASAVLYCRTQEQNGEITEQQKEEMVAYYKESAVRRFLYRLLYGKNMRKETLERE